MKYSSLIFIFLLGQLCIKAQSPVDGLEKISKEFTLINKKYVEYQSTMAHSDNAKKAEQKRQALLNQLVQSQSAIAQITPYQNDPMLQKGISDYLKLMEYSMNEDYTKMVNMKQIAEESYDKMEMYMQVKNQVSEKMEKASEAMSQVQKDYCKKYNIQLVETTTELDKQIEAIGQVARYTDKLQLIFLKCSFLDEDLVEAIGKKNINETEQLRSAMQQYAEEGLRILDTMQAFKGDRSLINACKKSMQFFKEQSQKSADFTELFTQQDNFNRIKQQFESDKSKQSDKDAVKKYNDAVDAMNKAINKSNKTMESINQARKETYDNWNNANKQFLDKHVPLV